jgi:hypothetical protein
MPDALARGIRELIQMDDEAGFRAEVGRPDASTGG